MAPGATLAPGWVRAPVVLAHVPLPWASSPGAAVAAAAGQMEQGTGELERDLSFPCSEPFNSRDTGPPVGGDLSARP